jgi:putative transposase
MNKERKQIRLTDWDYSSEGIYFITICCRDRQSFFGKINNNEMILSEIGLIASQYWLEIPDHFPHVLLDEFVVMPNHIHGILILDYSIVGTRHGVSLHSPSREIVGSCHGMTLPGNNIAFNGDEPGNNMKLYGKISNDNAKFEDNFAPDDQTSQPNENDLILSSSQNINQFSKPVKNSVSVIINQYKSSVKRWCNKNRSNHFQWQSRFYDQILHDENSIDKIREYISTNPKYWIEDELYN